MKRINGVWQKLFPHWFVPQLRKECDCEEKFCIHIYICMVCEEHITHGIHLIQEGTR